MTAIASRSRMRPPFPVCETLTDHIHCSVASPSGTASEEGLSAAELKHRRDLEYEEDENPEEAVIELKHAALSIPNIPIPKSSDGNVSCRRLPS